MADNFERLQGSMSLNLHLIGSHAEYSAGRIFLKMIKFDRKSIK